MLDAKIALPLLWTRSSRTRTWEEGRSRGTESPERGPVSSRKTDRLHGLWPLSCYWCSWYSFWLRWFILCHSSRRQCSGLRHEMGWFSSVHDQDPTWWRPGKSAQIENTWIWPSQNRLRIVRLGNSSKDIDAQLSDVEDDGEKNFWSEASITNFWRQTCENRNKSSGLESQGIKWCWKRKRYLLPVEKKAVFQGRPMYFLAWEYMRSRRQKPWNNHDDRWSYCLRQSFGHVDYSSIMWKVHQLQSREKIFAKTMFFQKWNENNYPHFSSGWTNIHWKSDHCVPTVVHGVIVDASPRSDGTESKIFPDWLEPFTEGPVERMWIIWQCWCINHQNTSYT